MRRQLFSPVSVHGTKRVQAVLLPALILVGCFTPAHYRVSFPLSGAEAVPNGLFADSENILALPCWRWAKISKNGFGPPVIFPADELSRFPELLDTWRGVEIVDVFSHEGGKAPLACGALLVGSGGKSLRLDYLYASPRALREKGEFYWEKRTAMVGPELKAALAKALADRKMGSATVELLFGHVHGEILGESRDLQEAADFVAELDAAGDDIWRPISE